MARKEETVLCVFDIFFTRNVPHILEMIFFSLDYESFKACMEVCKTWNSLLKSETFHTKAKSLFSVEIMVDEEKLFLAASDGNIIEARQLVCCGLVNVNNNSCLSFPLHEAASHGHVAMVQFLLDKGADPNKATDYGGTPLYEATFRKHSKVVKLLLEGGADPNKGNHYETKTPLARAVFNGQEDVVKLLLDSGADPNVADEGGTTPLHEASKNGSKDIIIILLEGGADLNKGDGYGWTPLHYSSKECNRDIIHILQN